MKPERTSKLTPFLRYFLGSLIVLFSVVSVSALLQGNFKLSLAVFLVGVAPPTYIILTLLFFERFKVDIPENKSTRMGIGLMPTLIREFDKKHPGWPAYLVKYGLGGMLILIVVLRLIDVLD